MLNFCVKSIKDCRICFEEFDVTPPEWHVVESSSTSDDKDDKDQKKKFDAIPIESHVVESSSTSDDKENKKKKKEDSFEVFLDSSEHSSDRKKKKSSSDGNDSQHPNEDSSNTGPTDLIYSSFASECVKLHTCMHVYHIACWNRWKQECNTKKHPVKCPLCSEVPDKVEHTRVYAGNDPKQIKEMQVSNGRSIYNLQNSTN